MNKPRLLAIAALAAICCFTTTGCTVSLAGMLASGASALTNIVSPVARKARPEGPTLIGARLGDVGAGVWAGRIEPGETAEELRRKAEISAAIADYQARLHEEK